MRTTALVAVLLLTCTGASAGTTGNLQVEVIDDTGRPLPNAHLELTSAALMRARSITTPESGVVTFVGLPPGYYCVEPRAVPYESSIACEHVHAGATQVLGFRLPIVKLYCTIFSDYSFTPALSLWSTHTGQVFTYDVELTRLPLQ